MALFRVIIGRIEAVRMILEQDCSGFWGPWTPGEWVGSLGRPSTVSGIASMLWGDVGRWEREGAGC